jgi:hypothetical protein
MAANPQARDFPLLNEPVERLFRYLQLARRLFDLQDVACFFTCRKYLSGRKANFVSLYLI